MVAVGVIDILGCLAQMLQRLFEGAQFYARPGRGSCHQRIDLGRSRSLPLGAPKLV